MTGARPGHELAHEVVHEVVHGGLHDDEIAALGLDAAQVLDLSANLHPDGPHPAVRAAFAGADVGRYPHPDATPLRDAIAERSNLDPAQVLVTPGATAAIHLAARVLLRAGDRCALFPPTFGEYEAAIRLAGAHAVRSEAVPPAFDPPPREEIRPAPLAMLCNPNNPTGVHLERDSIDALASLLGGVLLLDVAYAPFVVGGWDADDLVREGAPVLVLHSMTKLHAIPGLRVGYLTGPADLVARLTEAQHAWSVGAPAIAAGLAALEVEAERLASIPAIDATRERLRAALLKAGREVAPSRANFLLVRVGDGALFRARLLHRGYAVRDCSSFGLPEWVRIGVPPEGAADDLERVLRATLEESRERTR